ncbi:hypothetical protein RRG08_008631 [Elysia crispata]|uniref:Uncharacterized protein n=1 Tax=Elysia crispata TaxID=231223 RepID=A0AAE0XYD9_9GAST|nr:hypothetical protein RRG08_008631 [Elysia crispata]
MCMRYVVPLQYYLCSGHFQLYAGQKITDDINCTLFRPISTLLPACMDKLQETLIWKELESNQHIEVEIIARCSSKLP